MAAAHEPADALTVLFASADFELASLGEALAARGVHRTLGVTTSRVIGALGIEASGVTGFHLPAGRFAAAETVIPNAATIGVPELRGEVRRLRAELDASPGAAGGHLFALLFVDAEARCEERLAALLGMELKGIPLVGGSAGDTYFNSPDQAPAKTPLLYRGRAYQGAAILSLVRSATPLVAYCHNHYVASDQRVVITDADPARRLVRTLDGRRALDVYAEKCGFSQPPRDSADFAPYPLMIRIGGQYYARGTQRIYPDGTLELACALETGLVVALARPGDMAARLTELFETMRIAIGTPELVIGVDCAARTAYMEQRKLTPAISALMQSNSVCGFASLGEQFNTMHANNSLTCLGIAAWP
jgi:hypothetical protein